MENYIVINGKKINLTEEQIKILTESEKEQKNVIHRVNDAQMYKFFDSTYDVLSSTEWFNDIDNIRFAKGNYYPQECGELAIQDSLHDELRSRLRMFSRNHEWDESRWKFNNIVKYGIHYDAKTEKFNISLWWSGKQNDVYFVSREVAEQAIEEVIKPFIRVNPNFVW